jgi:hypothetical protein
MIPSLLKKFGKPTMKPSVWIGLLVVIVLVSIYLFREGYTNPPSSSTSSDNLNPGASAAWAAQNAAMNAAAVAAATGGRSTTSTTAGTAGTAGTTGTTSRGGAAVTGTQQGATSAAPAASTSRTATTDASGVPQNMISLSLVDLIKALSFSNKTGSPDDALKPPVFLPSTNVLPFPLDSSGSSVTLSEASEKRITSDILKTLKDQMLAERATAPVNADTGCSSGMSEQGCATDSCYQGSQYASKQAGGVSRDPNDYIRKDKIPCWGCQLAGGNCNLSH